jgi:hypothetical protein
MLRRLFMYKNYSRHGTNLNIKIVNTIEDFEMLFFSDSTRLRQHIILLM